MTISVQIKLAAARSRLASWDLNLLLDHLADLYLNFLLDADWNAHGVRFGLFFRNGIADGNLIRLFACLGDSDAVADRASLLFWNDLAGRYLTSALFLSAELNLIFKFLL